MGLMLSVLVFCVGVIEVLDCWHHLLYHLNHLRPLQHSKVNSSKNPVLELKGPPDSRGPSSVDISWPKDLSPSDDLHVIRRRHHSESERSEHEREHDKSSKPQIVIHSVSGDDEEHGSPPVSRESSPNHLELSVIVESDSSSEMDEPTQIENLAYRKKIEALNSRMAIDEGKEHAVESIDVDFPILKDTNESTSQRPDDELMQHHSEIPFQENCISPENPQASNNDKLNSYLKLQPTNENEDEEVKDMNKELTSIAQHSCEYINHLQTNVSPSRPLESGVSKNGIFQDQFNLEATPDNLDTDSATYLPVFTASILSDNVTKVTCHYPSENGYSTEDCSLFQKDQSSHNTSVHEVILSSKEIINIEANKFDVGLVASSENIPANKAESNVEIVTGFDVSENLPECPGIRLSESSPVLRQDSSDSSLNTSDASWMVKSKLSDKPDEKEASNTPETAAELFMSVTKVDLQLFASDKTEKQISRVEQDHKMVALENDLCKIETDNNKFSEETALQSDLAELKIDNLDITNSKKDKDSKPSSSLRHSSSSSSLSGIPQLPEDTKDTSGLPLPTDNGFGNETMPNESLDVEYDSLSEDIVQSLPTDGSSYTGKQHNISVEEAPGSTARHERTEETDKVDLDESNLSPEIGHSRKSPKNIDNEATCVAGNKETNSSPMISAQSQHLSLSDDVLPKSKSSTDSNPAVLCKAKESDQKDLADKRAQTVSVRTSEPKEIDDVKKILDEPRPSTSTAPDNAVASTSTAHENKAFWLIFSGEYTKAMNKDWHSGHFCCWQCDESLTGQRYVLRDEHPYCIKCYETVFSNGCEECSKTIGIDSKDLSYKDKHWHEACFLCNKCRVSLVDKQFGSKLDKIFCGNCYDTQFASRCDGCGQIFKAGTKKMEYKTRQWHEPCFACCVCKSAIGTKSFIPREQEIYCATCYEEKFATRCVKCNKIITSGGVTYKNEPWHRECFTCSNCSTSLAGQRFTSRDEKPYCADCFGELFAKRCTACCKPITGIGGTRFISFEDRHWHNDCFICASCKTSLVGRGFITDAEDIICPECAKQKLM